MQRIQSVLYALCVSQITCKGEAELRGREYPRYGSLRFIVTKAQIDGQIYTVDRYGNTEHASKLLKQDIAEERLILEISYVLEKNKVVDRHKHVANLQTGQLYSLSLVENPYVRKGHLSHVIKKNDKNILTYFVKGWGDYVLEPEVVTEEEKIYIETPLVMTAPDLVTHYISHLSIGDLVTA